MTKEKLVGIPLMLILDNLPMKENVFCPMLVFRNGQINFLFLNCFDKLIQKLHSDNWELFSKIYENDSI